MIALLLIFAGGAPIALLATVNWSRAASHSAASSQDRARYLVTAVLVQNAPQQADVVAMPSPRVEATWLGHDGTLHTGKVTAAEGAPVGATVRVWTDASGRLAGPPPRHSRAVGTASFVTIVLLAMMLLPLCAGVAIHGLMDRRRMAAWEADWAVTGPRWSSRR